MGCGYIPTVCSAGWVFVPEGQLKITDMSHTAHSSPLSLPPSQTLILFPSLRCSSVQKGLGVSMVTGFMWVQSVEYRRAKREGRESCKCEENWNGSKRERESRNRWWTHRSSKKTRGAYIHQRAFQIQDAALVGHSCHLLTSAKTKQNKNISRVLLPTQW